MVVRLLGVFERFNIRLSKSNTTRGVLLGQSLAFVKHLVHQYNKMKKRLMDEWATFPHEQNEL